MSRKSTFALLLFLFGLVPAVAITQVYSVTDLGALSPTAINAWAQVAGNVNNRAFIWTRAGGLQAFGVLSGGTFSSAVAINDLGIVAGTADGAGVLTLFDSNPPLQQSCKNLVQPFVWRQATGMRGLGAPAPNDLLFFCGPYTYASDINLYGQVVGGASEDKLRSSRFL